MTEMCSWSCDCQYLEKRVKWARVLTTSRDIAREKNLAKLINRKEQVVQLLMAGLLHVR